MTIDIPHLRSWIGRTETQEDAATPTPVRALKATLDRDELDMQAGTPLPPCWHWLYFLQTARHSEIGVDGHPQRGGFLPPVPLPRRMWAGSRIQFLAPLKVGDALVRNSRIQDLQVKEGRSGPLVFVKLLHEIHRGVEQLIAEEQDIVYRDLPAAGEPAPVATAAPTDAHWTRRVQPDAVMLFRYSALTFNGHRIHYDRPYAMQAEGYPGLVVHGPLIATLLLDLLRCEKPDARLTHFQFRAVRPLFDTSPFTVCGRDDGGGTIRLWACNEEGHLAMDATVIVQGAPR